MIKLLIVLLLTICFLHCGKKSVAGTETDTGQISGWVIYEDKTGVKGADVILRNSEDLKIITISKKRSATANGAKNPDSLRTSPAGFFSFEQVAFGDYFIEINDHDSLGAVAQARITEDKPFYSIDSITLKRFGTIAGTVDRSLLGNDGTFIYLVELNRKVPVDSLGYFLIEQVPASVYSIRLGTDGEILSSPLDTVTVTITPEDTVSMENIGTEFGNITIKGTVKEND